KAGSGTLTLSGANTYSGGTSVNAGTLSIGNDSALGSGALTFNGGTLGITASTNTTRAFTVNSTSGAISIGPGNSYSTSGPVSGAGNPTIAGGGGQMALIGIANPFTGTFTINPG